MTVSPLMIFHICAGTIGILSVSAALLFEQSEIGVRPAILRSCLTLSSDKIPSASICIHQPQRSITRHAEEFGTLMIENQ